MPMRSKSQHSFARAYDFIIADKALTPAEKLVMTEICRYWPKPCYESAETIAKHCGLDSRYVRNLISGMCRSKVTRRATGKRERPAYLKRAYQHRMKRGKKSTCRVIVPLCFPTKLGARTGASSAPMTPGGRAYSPTPSAPIGPPNRSSNRNENRKEEERDASPLPAQGQASASRYTSLREVIQTEAEEEHARKRAEAEEELAAIEEKLKIA